MSKTDKLKAKIGDRVAQSTGTASNADQPKGPAPKDPRYDGVRKSKNAETIRLDRIVPDPDQPRKVFEEEAIERMARTLKSEGQLQAIRVRYDSSEKVFVIVEGERRYRAAKMLGWTELECLVESGDFKPSEILVRQVIANEVREELNEVDLANAIRRLVDEEGVSSTEAYQRFGLNRFKASRVLALLDLPVEVQEMVKAGELPASTANKLTALENPEDQVETAKKIVKEDLSRDSAEREIKVLAEQREEEKAENQEPTEDESAEPLSPADLAGDLGVATAVKATAAARKAEKKVEKKAKKPEKVKKIMQFSHHGYKIHVERAKGIDLEDMARALDFALAQVRDNLKALAEGSKPYPLGD